MKRGGWLAFDDGTGLVYAAKGNRTSDFYAYDPIADTWSELALIPSGPTGKLPKKGCRGVCDGHGFVYMTRGHNTFEFWCYKAGADSWFQIADVPSGPSGKKVKGGTDLVYVTVGDTGYVYCLKGYRREFWRYNTASSRWEPRADAPAGTKGKWPEGSWLANDGEHTIYAHKAKYHDGAQHEFWKYDIPGDSWYTTRLAGMPLYGLHSGKVKKKRAGYGGAGVWHENRIYGLKGGNTQQLFRYRVDADTWVELDTLPANGSTGRKRRVKYGGDMVSLEAGNVPALLFVLKGNRTREFWFYEDISDAGSGQGPEPRSVQGRPSVPAEPTGLRIVPNPASGFADLVPRIGRIGNWSVVNSTGQCMLVGSGAGQVDLRGLASGVYLVRAQTGAGEVARKLVVLR